MDSEAAHNDRRKTCRFAPPVRQTLLVRVRRTEYSAHILNESAGGFALCLEGEVPAKSGQRVAFRDCDKWLQAEVVYVHHHEQETQIGLRRTDQAAQVGSGGRLSAVSLMLVTAFAAAFLAQMFLL